MKKIIHYLAAILVVVLGCSVMLAWLTHQYALLQANSQFEPMQFNAAIGFIISGLALLTMTHWRRISGVLGFIVFLLGLLTLLEHITLIDLYIDQLVIKNTDNSYQT